MNEDLDSFVIIFNHSFNNIIIIIISIVVVALASDTVIV